MMRAVLSSLVVVLLAGTASAEEIRGVVTKIDTEKNTIMVTVDGKDLTFDVAKDVRVSTWTLMTTGRRRRATTTTVETILADGLRSIRIGMPIALNVEMKDERRVVSSIQIDEQQFQSSPQGRRRRR